MKPSPTLVPRLMTPLIRHTHITPLVSPTLPTTTFVQHRHQQNQNQSQNQYQTPSIHFEEIENGWGRWWLSNPSVSSATSNLSRSTHATPIQHPPDIQTTTTATHSHTSHTPPLLVSQPHQRLPQKQDPSLRQNAETHEDNQNGHHVPAPTIAWCDFLSMV
ncbi:hypothetical protein IAR55_003651 [Kwoniella newhampshirensis]|uniref:Uncharacterized protein n=1 Tax=Kwoniella newhampshirensis TaxID=1651941 RepID=A0AAW0YN06_9TREE